jgi:hypothetical protein
VAKSSKSERRRRPDGHPREALEGRVQEFPPRAKAASFTVSDAMKKIEAASPN